MSPLNAVLCIVDVMPASLINACQQGRQNSIIPPNAARTNMNFNWTTLYQVPGSKLAIWVNIVKYSSIISIPGGVQTVLELPIGTAAGMLTEYGLNTMTNISTNTGRLINISYYMAGTEIVQTNPSYDWYFTINDIDHTVQYTNFYLSQLSNY